MTSLFIELIDFGNDPEYAMPGSMSVLAWLHQLLDFSDKLIDTALRVQRRQAHHFLLEVRRLHRP